MEQARSPDRRGAGPAAPMRNQSITQFFKPSQSADCVTEIHSRARTCNDSKHLLSSSAKSRGAKASSAKTRKSLPVLSPDKSPIMEAFHKGRKPHNVTVSSKPTHCATCLTSCYPIVLVKKLSLPPNILSFCVGNREEAGKSLHGSNVNLVTFNCTCRKRSTQGVHSGYSNVKDSALPQKTGLFHCNKCIDNWLNSQSSQSSLVKQFASVASTSQAAVPTYSKAKTQKKGKTQQRNRQAFSPGRTGSDEVINQVNSSSPDGPCILLMRNSVENRLSDSYSDGSEDCSLVSRRKLQFSSINPSSQVVTSNKDSLSLNKSNGELKGSCITEQLDSNESIGQKNNGKINDVNEHVHFPNYEELLAQSMQVDASPLRNDSLHSAYVREDGLPLVTSLLQSSSIPDSSQPMDLDPQPTLPKPLSNSPAVLGISSNSGSGLSSDDSCSSKSKRKRSRKGKRRKPTFIYNSSDEDYDVVSLSSDKEEDTLIPLHDILGMATKPLSSSISEVKRPHTARKPDQYVNNLEQLLKEKEEDLRISDLEKQLRADLEKGIQMYDYKEDSDSNDGELLEEHKAFLKRFCVVSNAIPDLHPGQEIFQLSTSGSLFTQNTLDLRNSGYTAENTEENIIFSCDMTHQLMLASEGFLNHVYRSRNCPTVIMKWLFQMMSIHPSYLISVKLLSTSIDLISTNISFGRACPWIPSLQDVIYVFANMGVHFETLEVLQHVQAASSCYDLVSAMNISEQKECQNVNSKPVFTQVPESHITNVIKFLGFCTALCPESYSDQEILALLSVLFKIYMEKELGHVPVVDLQCLVNNLFQNIKDWETKMPEMCSVLGSLCIHHHDLLKLVQLVPPSESRGREVRRHLSLIIISKLLYGNTRTVPVDYGLQMSFLCQCLVDMKPSNLVRKLQSNLENAHKVHQELDQEAYYLAHSLLNLVKDATTSDASPSMQRQYLLKLCGTLEKHIKCDIREDARFFYKSKVKDLIAMIHGKWQEFIHYTRPDQGKIYDYWKPDVENSNQSSSSEESPNEDAAQ